MAGAVEPDLRQSEADALAEFCGSPLQHMLQPNELALSTNEWCQSSPS
jgi:hypothetical protein